MSQHILNTNTLDLADCTVWKCNQTAFSGNYDSQHKNKQDSSRSKPHCEFYI